jgi:hydroxyacylglutathione hydrolase
LLYESFSTTLAELPDATRVYPGHEYLERNLAFTLDREPSNQAARSLAQLVGAGASGAAAPVLSLGEERQVNVFLRLDSPDIIAHLPRATTPRMVFLALRELRNRW